MVLGRIWIGLILFVLWNQCNFLQNPSSLFWFVFVELDTFDHKVSMERQKLRNSQDIPEEKLGKFTCSSKFADLL